MEKEEKKTTSKKTTTKKSAPKKSTAKKTTTKKTTVKKATPEVKEEVKKVEVEEKKEEVVVETKEVKEQPKKKAPIGLIIGLICGALLLLLIIIIAIVAVLVFSKKDVVINEKVKFEVNDSLTIKDVVGTNKNIILVEPNKELDLSKIGENTINVAYVKANDRSRKIRVAIFTINVVDDEAPVITCDDSISIFIGDELNITNRVNIEDNSKETIIPEIEGDYKLDTVGEYDVKIKAKDSSGNESSKDVKFIVKQIEVKKTGYYIYKTKEAWDEYYFKGNEVYRAPWYCPNKEGFGCGGAFSSGTYKIEGNKLIATFTESVDDVGDKFKDAFTLEFTIISEDELVLDGHTYKWSKYYEDDWHSYFDY